MRPQEIRQLIQELADQVKQEVLNRMTEKGVNRKAGKDTLTGSDLYKSVRATAYSNAFTLEIADYYIYVVSGRKPGKMPPYNAILEWVRKKGIHFSGKTENQTVWAVMKSVARDGIEARPFIGADEDPTKAMPFITEYFDAWADKVFQLLIEEIDEIWRERK